MKISLQQIRTGFTGGYCYVHARSAMAPDGFTILTAQKLGYSVYEFKRIVRRMRKHIGVVEALMSAGRWDEIRYSAVTAP